jgi:hypothetical protein
MSKYHMSIRFRVGASAAGLGFRELVNTRVTKEYMPAVLGQAREQTNVSRPSVLSVQDVPAISTRIHVDITRRNQPR